MTTKNLESMDDFPAQRVMLASVVRVVDDDAEMLASYAFMLGAAGWTVKRFQSAEAFLADPGASPGCLVLDVRMPDMSGLELQAEMNRRGIALPIIFVTGHGDVDMAVQTMKDGAGDFMLKPVVPERLKAAVLLWCRRDCIRNVSRLQESASAQDFQTLSLRERQVAQLILEGHSTKDIAQSLQIAERTVKFHRASIKEKLGAETTPQLLSILMRFRQKGFLTDTPASTPSAP